jgi:hypothetical protein
MNIVQMHEAVRFWLDVVRSPRYEEQAIDTALNLVVEKILDEKTTYASLLHSADSVQATQRVRDQLGTLVRRLTHTQGLVITPGAVETKIAITDKSQYRHMLELSVFEGTDKYPCFALSHMEHAVINQNPYRKPRLGTFSRLYFMEEDGATLVVHPDQITIDGAEMFILRQPLSMNYGLVYDSTKAFVAGDKVIVVDKYTKYNGLDRFVGEEITIAAPNFNITEGRVTFNYRNTELSITLREEMTRRAAVELLRTTGQMEKATALLSEMRVG